MKAFSGLAAVFADFNEDQIQPIQDQIADTVVAPDERNNDCAMAWTEGYLTALNHHTEEYHCSTSTARLLTSIAGLEATIGGIVEAAALAVANLLIEGMIEAASEVWSSYLVGRIHLMAERIKPLLEMSVQYFVRDRNGIKHQFSDIPALVAALGDGLVGEEVMIHWHNGEAVMSKTDFLRDLCRAVLPMSFEVTAN